MTTKPTKPNTSLLHRRPRSGLWPILICGTLLSALSLLLVCFSGPMQITPAQVLEVFSLKLASWQGSVALPATPSPEFLVVWELRLARAMLSFGVGAALGLAGLLLQSVLQNYLADPFTLGVASGAALGASLALVLGLPPFLGFVVFGFTLPPLPILPLCALVGAMLALFMTLFLVRGGGLSRPETLALAGVICSSFLAAMISLVKALNEDSVASIVFWIMGSFQGRGWREFQLFWPLFVAGLIPALLLRRALDLLSLGAVQAEQLGLRAGRSRLWLMLAAGALAAGAVSVAGIIGFVGLLSPHLGRLLFARFGWSRAPSNLLLFSMFAGGLLLLWSDALARRILSLLADNALGSGAELPVGVITSLLGAPVFCYLLRRQQTLSGKLQKR